MSQLEFFKPTRPRRQKIEAADADLTLFPEFLSPGEASRFLEELMNNVPWRQDHIRLYGKVHAVPRLQQWFADDGLVYTWSGIEMQPEPWSSSLDWLRGRLHHVTGQRFNTVLANYYRNGNDTVGWHSDDEKELGKRPIIASISLGASRDFVLRHKTRTDVEKVVLRLTHGSLLVMSGDTQACWQHALPRRKRVSEARVNLTFRFVRPSDETHRGPTRYKSA
jgi:alkylated DNA repair dioxygenase AlkB